MNRIKKNVVVALMAMAMGTEVAAQGVAGALHEFAQYLFK